MIKKIMLAALCLCLITGAALADSLPYGGYASTPYGGVAPTPAGYDVDAFLSGADMGAGNFSKPEDMYLEPASGFLYIADTGNKRVVALDAGLRFVREFTGAGDTALASPKGVFADGAGRVYIADDVLGAVFMLSADGQLLQTFSRPVSDLYEDATPFMPQKVVADSAGRVYVLSQGVFQGLICYNPDGSFLNFYGANHVEVTLKVALQKLLRVFMTRAQRGAMESFIPIEYSNIDIDRGDMIYAAVGTLEQTTAYSLYKLNPLGAAYRKHAAGPLTDALSDENGYYTVLWRDTKEIMEFGENTFGVALTCAGYGAQKGLLQDPSAIARQGDKLLALDRQNGMLTRYAPTAFGKLVHQAAALSNQGKYQEAVAVFEELLRLDHNYTSAYAGLGKAYYEMERYAESMRAYKLANNKQGYSDAFKEYTTGVLRDNMAWLLSGCAALFLLSRLWKRHRRKTAEKRRDSKAFLKPWRHPLHCMTHAYSGFEGVKLDGNGSMAASWVILGLLFLSSVVSYVLTGFAYNPNRIERLNVLLLLAGSLGSFGLFYVSSLAVSSLMSDCEGKPRELFMGECYALLPFILGTIITAAATNFLTLDVRAFVVIFNCLCIGWSVILLFVGMMQINQLTFKKTLLYLLLVALTLAIVLVLLVLLYSLIQQFAVFLQTLYSEMMYRL